METCQWTAKSQVYVRTCSREEAAGVAIAAAEASWDHPDLDFEVLEEYPDLNLGDFYLDLGQPLTFRYKVTLHGQSSISTRELQTETLGLVRGITWFYCWCELPAPLIKIYDSRLEQEFDYQLKSAEVAVPTSA